MSARWPHDEPSGAGDADGYVVEVGTAIADPAGWDDVVIGTGASLFHRSAVLESYRRHPLHDTIASFYLTVRRRGGEHTVAVLPVYLVPAVDPLGVLGDILPGFVEGGRPLLLSHIWHWYDACLPARRLDKDLVSAVCATLRRLAGQHDAQAFGFVNVQRDDPLGDRLRTAGLTGAVIDSRYQLDLEPFGSPAEYEASLRPGPRQELRRHVRRAERAGAVVTVDPPHDAQLDRIAELCQLSASKHGNPTWYVPQRLAGFVRGLGDLAQIVTVWHEGAPVAASISFVDGHRLHNWVAGSHPVRRLAFSPYLVLLHATLDLAMSEKCTLLEGGRRNGQWKERLGMRPVDLYGWLAAG